MSDTRGEQVSSHRLGNIRLERPSVGERQAGPVHPQERISGGNATQARAHDRLTVGVVPGEDAAAPPRSHATTASIRARKSAGPHVRSPKQADGAHCHPGRGRPSSP